MKICVIICITAMLLSNTNAEKNINAIGKKLKLGIIGIEDGDFDCYRSFEAGLNSLGQKTELQLLESLPVLQVFSEDDYSKEVKSGL